MVKESRLTKEGMSVMWYTEQNPTPNFPILSGLSCLVAPASFVMFSKSSFENVLLL